MGYLYLLPFYIIGILKLLFFVLYACRETDEYGCILFYHSSLYIGSKLLLYYSTNMTNFGGAICYDCRLTKMKTW